MNFITREHQLLINISMMEQQVTAVFADNAHIVTLLAMGLVYIAALFNFFNGNGAKKLIVQKMQQMNFFAVNAAVAVIDRSKKYILITGCDRGLGYAMAKSLDTYGFSVIAGCLDVNDDNVKKLQEETSENLKAVQLDVTKMEQLDNVKTWMKENIKGELWGIVNNAGVCFMGTPEIMGQKDIEQILFVNLVGTINVTKKFQPLIRKAKGRIVNIGSINGEVPMPFFSLYNATKAGVRMFTECLGYELKDWGVKVSLISPAGFKTGIIQYDKTARARKWFAEADEEGRRDFGEEYFTMPMRKYGRMRLSADFSPVTDSVLHALTSDFPNAVYRPGHQATILPALCRYTPQAFRSYYCGNELNFISAVPAALQNNEVN